jgi:hypothetical protein
VGDLLQATFDATGGPNEAHLTAGDSGGGLFVQDEGVWKLAGVNYGVDAKFSLSGENGTSFDAAIFDMGGLYFGEDNRWLFMDDRTDDIASAFYATRVSTNADWIAMVTVPEPPGGAAIAGLGLLVAAVWRRWRKPAASAGSFVSAGPWRP